MTRLMNNHSRGNTSRELFRPGGSGRFPSFNFGSTK